MIFWYKLLEKLPFCNECVVYDANIEFKLTKRKFYTYLPNLTEKKNDKSKQTTIKLTYFLLLFRFLIDF